MDNYWQEERQRNRETERKRGEERKKLKGRKEGVKRREGGREILCINMRKFAYHSSQLKIIIFINILMTDAK